MKSQYAEANMLTLLSEMHCPCGGDVRSFLGSMRVKCEELSAVRVIMSDKKYWSAIIKFLPEEMSKFASSLLTASCVIQPTTQIDPNILINHIFKEANRLSAWCKQDSGSSGKGKQPQSQGQDEVLAAMQGEGRKRKRKWKCHNCGKQGHWACECQSPKKDQQSNNNQNQLSGQSSQQQNQPLTYQNATKAENKPVGSANAIDNELDRCWSAVFIGNVLESEAPVPTPQQCEEAGAGATSPGGLAAAAITQMEESRQHCIELYNSGATHHIPHTTMTSLPTLHSTPHST